MSNAMLIPVLAPQAPLASWSNRKPSTDPIRDELVHAERTGKHKPDHQHDDDDRRHMDDSERPGRRNPLVNAMMQALQGLIGSAGSGQAAGIAPAPAAQQPVEAPAAGAPISTEPATAVDEPPVAMPKLDKAARGELKDAAAAFAHELFNALRGDGESDEVGRHHPGRGHHFGHHHRHGHGGERFENTYSNLVQRLQELAAGLGRTQPQAAASVEPARSVTTSLPDTPEAAALAAAETELQPVPSQPGETAAAVAVTSGVPTTASRIGIGISFNINITVEFTAMAGAAQAASPLLAAFENLLEKLQTTVPAAGTDDDAASPTDRLRQFLLGIASSLQTSMPGREDQALQPQSGSLIDVTA